MAQPPDCNAGLIYIINGTQIKNFDPTLPQSAINPWVNTITLNPSSSSLAVSNNLNGGATSPTFYTISGGTFWYYDGPTNSFINTGHSTGNGAAVNIGGGGNYIYNLVGSTGQIYRYDGTGPATLLTTIASFAGGGPYDVVGDCAGNFYLLNNMLHTLEKYNSNGTLIATYTSNSIASPSGGGFAIIGNKIYYDNGSYFEGVLNQGALTVTFNTTPGTSLGPSDFASCPVGALGTLQVSQDTIYYCGTGPGTQVNVIPANPNCFWTVASGNGNITGTGTSVILSASSDTRFVVHDTTGVCGPATDTVDIILPKATLDAGSDIIVACRNANPVQLSAAYSDTTAGIRYSFAWSPADSILTGITTLSPTAKATNGNVYTITLKTDTAKGGCTFTDDVKVVRAAGCGDIVMPSAFSPNGDNRNDWFRATGATDNISYFKLEVYNRWGQLVYASADVMAGWNGKVNSKPVDMGSYVWLLTYTTRDTGVTTKKEGNVTLVR